MNKYIGIILWVLCVVLPGAAQGKVCNAPNYDVSKQLAAQREKVKAQTEKSERDQIENSALKSCIDTTVKPLKAGLKRLGERRESAQAAYDKVLQDVDAPTQKVVDAKALVVKLGEQYASLEKQISRQTDQCKSQASSARKSAKLNVAVIERQIAKRLMEEDSEDVRKLRQLEEQDRSNQRVLAWWDAGKLDLIEDLSGFKLDQVSEMRQKIGKNSIGYVLQVAYARLTNGGTVCRINLDAMKNLTTKVAGFRNLSLDWEIEVSNAYFSEKGNEDEKTVSDFLRNFIEVKVFQEEVYPLTVESSHGEYVAKLVRQMEDVTGRDFVGLYLQTFARKQLSRGRAGAYKILEEGASPTFWIPNFQYTEEHLNLAVKVYAEACVKERISKKLFFSPKGCSEFKQNVKQYMGPISDHFSEKLDEYVKKNPIR